MTFEYINPQGIKIILSEEEYISKKKIIKELRFLYEENVINNLQYVAILTKLNLGD